jgi:hypothetical protein
MPLVTLAMLLVAAVAADAATPFTKPYFAKTKPGAWAKYRQTDGDGQVTEYVYSRLADQGGQAWIEIAMAITAGQFKGTTSVASYLVSTEVPIEEDALGFARRLRRAAGQSNDVRATEYDATVVAAIAKATVDYASVVKPKGSDSVGGRACDLYTYTWSHAVPKLEETGEICLSDGVPFGVVRQVFSQKDAAGKVAKYEKVLTATGGDATSRLTGFTWAAAPATAGARPASPPSGASAAAPATPPSPSAPRFDGRGWSVGHQAKNARQSLVEYVLPGQTVDNWKELVTSTVYFDPRHSVPLARFVEQVRASMSNDCPSLVWNVIQQDDKTAIFEWRDAGCGGFPPQTELARLAVGPEGVYRLAYAVKMRGPLPPDKRKEWLGILGQVPLAETPGR